MKRQLEHLSCLLEILVDSFSALFLSRDMEIGWLCASTVSWPRRRFSFSTAASTDPRDLFEPLVIFGIPFGIEEYIGEIDTAWIVLHAFGLYHGVPKSRVALSAHGCMRPCSLGR